LRCLESGRGGVPGRPSSTTTTCGLSTGSPLQLLEPQSHTLDG
jgi:hypothetical protein